MIKTFFCAVMLVAVSGCLTATIQEPSACKSNTLTFTTEAGYDGGLDAGGTTVPPVTASTQVDLSSILTKLSNIGTIQASISKNILSTETGNFDWLRHIRVSIVGVYDPVNYPSATLVDQDVSTQDSSLSLLPVMSGDQIIHYLSQGPVELDFIITGTLPSNQPIVNAVDMTSDLCINSTVNVSKGI